MGPNEKALRELGSGVILTAWSLIVILVILLALVQTGAHVTLFCVRHFGPAKVVKQRCIAYCAREHNSKVVRDTPKITEKYSFYCECSNGKHVAVTRYGGGDVWDELLSPEIRFHN